MADQSDAETCLEHEELLSRWETEFCESLTNWDGDLTERQEEVLERIMQKVRDLLDDDPFN